MYFKELSKSYLEQKVFENLQGSINEDDKIGIVGINGVGKSTLMKIIVDKEKCDSGVVRRQPLNIKYAVQDICVAGNKLVSENLSNNKFGLLKQEQLGLIVRIMLQGKMIFIEQNQKNK